MSHRHGSLVAAALFIASGGCSHVERGSDETLDAAAADSHRPGADSRPATDVAPTDAAQDRRVAPSDTLSPDAATSDGQVTGSDGGPPAAPNAEVIGGGIFSCVRRGGSVWCWGSNASYECGDPASKSNHLTPFRVPGLVDAVQLSSSGSHVCAVRATGAVVCWGDNKHGQLGDGTTISRAHAVAVDGAGAVTGVAAGRCHTCVVRAGGTVACWGYFGNNDCEDGDGVTSSRPVVVEGLSGVVQIAAGDRSNCARRADGTVACWGRNTSGQLGDGTTRARSAWSAAAHVKGLSDAVHLGVGRLHACVVRRSGEVVCWGHGGFGEIGDGDPAKPNRSVPTPVANLKDAVAVYGGGHFTCARRANGSSVCWGDNRSGQFGIGRETGFDPNVRTVWNLPDAVNIGPGAHHMCALRPGGAVLCTGRNLRGELGDMTTAPRLVLTAVKGL